MRVEKMNRTTYTIKPQEVGGFLVIATRSWHTKRTKRTEQEYVGGVHATMREALDALAEYTIPDESRES